MRCVGIDLAWSPRNRSGGFALLVEEGLAHEAGWQAGLGCDDEIIAFIAAAVGQGPALVAIDAPIAVPNENGARRCDREITRVFGRFQAGAHPANRQALRRYGGLRAEQLAQRIKQELGLAEDPYIAHQATTRQMVEVFPHPGMVMLFGLDKTLKYKRGTVGQRQAELDRLQARLLELAGATPALRVGSTWRRDVAKLSGKCLKQYEDLLDSLFCAYIVAYCWYHGPEHYEVFGNVEEGHILVPMPPDQRLRLKMPAPSDCIHLSVRRATKR